MWGADIHEHVFPELFDLLKTYNVHDTMDELEETLGDDADYERLSKSTDLN
jgi:hypothetical protein